MLAHFSCWPKFKYMNKHVPKPELLAGNTPARLNVKVIDLQTSLAKFPALLAYIVKLWNKFSVDDFNHCFKHWRGIPKLTKRTGGGFILYVKLSALQHERDIALMCKGKSFCPVSAHGRCSIPQETVTSGDMAQGTVLIAHCMSVRVCSCNTQGLKLQLMKSNQSSSCCTHVCHLDFALALPSTLLWGLSSCHISKGSAGSTTVEECVSW